MLQAQQVLQGRYQLQQQLGQNPGRQTWLAQDVEVSPAESVIVKLLAFNPQMQWDEFKLFEREAQVLKQLNHSRIPRYRDYFSLDKDTGAGLCWFGLVQQYIPGTSVQQLLKQGKRFPETEVQKIAKEVLEILIYLHGLDPPVVHRDIKPSNLILGDDGKVYLVDFGAVQDTAAAEGVTFTVVGTTGYAPLEQFWGRTVPASDLYALGATLIHLLTGTAPADLPSRNLRIQFRDRISLNPRFTRWIEVLTEPDLEQRFTQASEALEALRTNRYPKTSIPTIPQPAGSRVQLKKSPNQLSLKIPRRERSLLDIIKLGGNLILTVGSLPFVLLQFLIIVGLVIGLFSTFFYSIFLFFIFLIVTLLLGWSVMATSQELTRVQDEVAQALRNLFGHDCLHFDKKYFVIERQ
ncbi:MAG: serine/threonine protein kinase, partial [Coleofasciculus sp. C3-bin4]|nr:serine/threonine protein kinase [Coleofasciculus sp. C3-bin4]